MSKNFEEQLIRLSRTGTHGNNPYHNFDHCFNVYQMCKRIYREELDKEVPESLMWAALFHDYNHSGGATDDIVNIETARDGVTEHFLDTKITDDFDKGLIPAEDLLTLGYQLRRVHELIECTVFDKGIFPVTPTTFGAKVIRDADLSSIFLPTEQAVESLRGLYKEMLVGIPDLTLSVFCERNVTFLTQATWFTETCQKLAATELPDRLDRVHHLLLANG
jgi:hypothetical protein